MAKKCPITGKGPMVGNNVSHANNKTKRRYLPNLQYKRFWLESEKRFVRIRVSTRGMRIIDKHGIETVLSNLKLRDQLSAQDK
jgi:large subunit ribosomal protein L28